MALNSASECKPEYILGVQKQKSGKKKWKKEDKDQEQKRESN